MWLIRNGYAVSTRRGFLGVLFSALLALALFDAGAATAQEGKQIKLTDKHIQSFMAAYKDMAKLYDGAQPYTIRSPTHVAAEPEGVGSETAGPRWRASPARKIRTKRGASSNCVGGQ